MDLQSQEQIGLYIVFAIYNVVMWPGLLFFILRRNFEPIKSRGFLLAIIQMLLGEAVMIFSIIPNTVSCFFRPAALLLIVPFVCIPYVIRGLVLYHRYILHDGMKIWAGRHKSTSLSSVDADAEMFLKNLSSNGNGSKNDSRNGTGNGSEHEEGLQRSASRKEKEKKKEKDGRSTVTKKEDVIKMVRRDGDLEEPGDRDANPASLENPENAAAAASAADAGEGRASRNPLFPEETRKKDFGLDLKLDRKFIWAVKHKHWFQDKFLIPLNFLLALPFIAVIILLFFLDEPRVGDAERNDFTIYVHNRCFTKGFIYYFLVQFAVTSPAISITGYLLLGVKEAFKVRIELMGVLFCGSLGTVGCLVSIFYPQMPPTLNYMFFASIGTTSMAFWTVVFPVIESYKFQKIERKEKPRSEEEQSSDSYSSDHREPAGGARTHENPPGEKKKKPKPPRAGDDEVLKIIFEEPELLKGFEEFAVSTWCMENVLFYKRVQQFKAITQEAKLAEQGKKIWTYHFERGCDFEVNVDAPVREKIMEMVQQNKYERDMFHDAEKIIFTMLRYNIYPLWKASSGFKIILDKLGSPDVLSVRARRRAAAKKLAEGA